MRGFVRISMGVVLAAFVLAAVYGVRAADKNAMADRDLVKRPDVVEIIGEGCRDSVRECTQKQVDECATRHPLPQGSAAKEFNRVTRFEEGKACEFLCYDAHGSPHDYSCEKESEPQSKPGDQTLRPANRGEIAPVGPVGEEGTCPAGYMKLDSVCVLSPLYWDEVSPETRSIAEREVRRRMKQTVEPPRRPNRT
jgi:hypothetical protein